MRKRYIQIVGYICLTFSLSAQNPAHKWSVSNGIGVQWFERGNTSWMAALEYHPTDFVHIGAIYNKFFEEYYENYDNYNPAVGPGSFEAGLYVKSFFKGRFTGRKSGLYIGADCRYGKLKSSFLQYRFLTGGVDTIAYTSTTAKVMVKWGVQWWVGKRAVIELTAPWGIEYAREPYIYSQDGYPIKFKTRNGFVILPALLIGFNF
ncbi:MAG: hypothetical protein JNJ57_15140 [Saprospiraceae bacterium]|nr:hypothetical protein [Saprospiraceae bacterium]